MMNDEQKKVLIQHSAFRVQRSGSLLLIAAWFGLVTGLLEGAGFLVFQKLGWLNWYRAERGVSLEIIWISTLFDLLLFGLVGLGLAAVARLLPRLPIIPLLVFLFGFVMFFDWLALSGRIHRYAVLILATGVAVQLTRWHRKREAATLRFWRRSIRWVAAVALLALVGIQGGLWLRERVAIATLPTASPGAPNILVIVMDTVRADHLACYGYARPTSPNLDRLAELGVLFENAIATSSWSPPSHASLLTGRYPYEHGVEWDRALDSRYSTLAEALRERGYRTGAFSANTSWFCRRMGFDRGFIHFDDYFHNIADTILRTLYGREFERFKIYDYLGLDDQRRASSVNAAVLGWIAREEGKPFFAFLNYFDAHAPYLPPQPYRSKFARLKEPRGLLFTLARDNLRLTPEQLQSEIDGYDGDIAYVDDHIGQLLTELQKRGLAENTLVVVTSDHGDSFREHGLFLHRNALYREVIHVPLIFWWPGRVPAGVRVARPVTNAAIPATVMALVGAGDQTLFPGPSLTKLWEAPEAHPDWPYPLSEMAQQPFKELKRVLVYSGWIKSLVSPEWHYIEHEKLGIELYDWRNDPQELHNLAERPEMQSVIARFQSELASILGNGLTQRRSRKAMNDE